jgi:serine/threonine-protein kinase
VRRPKTQYLTLLSGAAVAVVFLVADLRATPNAVPVSGSGKSVAATKGSTAAPTPSPAGTSTTVQVTLTPSTAPTSTAASAAAAVTNDYAGHVIGRGASVAISIYGGKVVAYVCGGKFEAWLTGTASNGTLTLTGRYGATLNATYDQSTAHGSATGAGHQWTFTIPAVHSPSGLYRAYAKSHRVQATWVVLPDGSQIGSVDNGGDAATAIPVGALDLSTLTSTLPDGTAVTATPLNAATGE